MQHVQRVIRAPLRVFAGSTRQFSSTSANAARRSVVHGARMIRPTLEDLEFDDDLPEDTTWAGHQVLAQQREELYYMRLIEHEMPKLVGECLLVTANTFA